MKKRMVLQYALRSIFRQKSRNFFIVFIVCVTCVFSLFTSSLFEGKNGQIRQNIIETETGQFQIIEKDFYERYDALMPAELTPELSSELKDYLYTPELILKTTILHPEGAQELTLIGIDTVSHEKVFPLKKNVTGEWPLVSTKGIVVGERFAKKLQLKIGDELVITYQDETRAILNESLPIVGTYHKFGPGFEGSHAYVLKSQIQALLHVKSQDAFHRLAIMGNSQRPSIQNPNLLVRAWDELNPELNVLMRFHNGVTRALIIFMLVIAYVSIITPINVLWDERKDEVKLLQTIGTNEETLYAIAAAEAFVLTVFSLVLASLIWMTLHLLCRQHGLDFSFMGESDVVRGGILISSTVYPVMNSLYALTIIGFHGILIFGSQLWCIRKVMRKEALGDT